MKLKFIILSIGIFNISVFSQNYDKSLLEQINPTDPTSSSLGKYGQYPVNHSTGLVPITIPLYEIKSGELSQTIELSYHGGGIRVNEEATWVGLGWDLNFGGVITRTMNGFPDELETQPLPNANTLFDNMHNNSDLSDLYYYESLANPPSATYSFKPDLFQYNFGKYSGTFFSLQNKPVSIAHAALNGSISSNGINLITPDGNQYDFQGLETTTLTGAMVKNAPYISGYYIKSILSANNTDTINYVYQWDGKHQSDLISYSQGYKTTTRTCAGGNSSCGCISSTSTEYIPQTSTSMFIQTVQSNKPHYIYFNGGRVTFNLSSRNDVNPANADKIKKLDNILIESCENGVYKTIKKFHFYYSYFNQGGDYNSLRLCLDSVVENAYMPSGEQILVSAFEYYGDKYLPNKKSFSSDYWGFYNGKNNGSPIPLTYDSYHIFGSADKTPNAEFAKYGTLKRIIYPTKGNTEFIWEGNRINSETQIYDVQEIANISLYSEISPSLVCYPTNPDPEIDGIKSITIHSYIDQYVKLNYYLYPIIQDNLTHNKYDIGTIKINGSEIATLSFNQATLSSIFYLHANQDYTIELNTNCYNVKGGIWFSYNTYNPNTDKNNYLFAGIRIKEINNYDTNAELIECKKYTYLNPNNHSSGFITNDRRLSYLKWSRYVNGGIEEFTCPSTTEIKTLLCYSNLKTGAEANNFGYEYVQEYSIINGQNYGYSDFQYTKGVDNFYGDEVPLVTKGHLRGQLIKRADYKYLDSSYQKVKEIQSFYSRDSRVSTKKQGFTMPRHIDFTNSDGISGYVTFGGETIYQSDIFQPTNYEYTSDWIKLDSTITAEYFEQSDSIRTKSSYVYGNEKHLQPNDEKKYLNNGDIIKSIMIYSADDNSPVAEDMKTRNMLIHPFDIKKYALKNGSIEKLIGGNQLTYSKDEYDHILLTKVSEHLPNETTEDIYEYIYNDRSRLIEVTEKDGVKTAIYWDAKNYNPIVIGKNISYSNLSGVLQTVNSNPAALYTSQDSRLQNTQMSTFSYFPLIGLQSKTDPRGVTTWYEYDDFNRLKQTYIIENGEKKILQKFDYHYANQK
jgi:YD repeat-containing protein